MTKLYVGNLSYETTEDHLKELFSQVGTVQSVNIIKDKYSERSKGFGFVEMSTEEEAKKAIAELNEKDFMGRNIAVAEAKPPREHGSGGGGYRQGRGGGGGGGFGGRRRERY
ncbi:RNA-binding protein [Candidatus Desantisbacteria bacterium CG1_02_38_46]|uniref:RNA-binding protein n=3 Tax=unclassified Candidatus Desantisiibacteriota TaxID=3106372 RepID=A0A2H9PB55_9BACT|nr:MAG: RNA-binding protein [Candidatus Desantisbacteria bacterium CG1_02_38_46]PIU51833.1 MAG: RNA-binding protein [Candidatus Desantisbacteria bacterium CG07_land_8_20_14_0_80_39_15]PIZ15933.1 MAG: RNA-binding protein [Candidatus Desantisbacteria bacterium CG_4_10_14_0_8_um_filter_39_17]